MVREHVRVGNDLLERILSQADQARLEIAEAVVRDVVTDEEGGRAHPPLVRVRCGLGIAVVEVRDLAISVRQCLTQG
jgi:hypothetical protein